MRINRSKIPRIFRSKKSQEEAVELSEKDGVLSLHLGSELVQSAMKVTKPHGLELAYTRCMMTFLVFNPQPKRVLLIGLGGGSLVKFIHHYFPETIITAVEINSQVVAAARSYFMLPEENERFQIIIADGAEYIKEQQDAFDVILIDGYEDGKMAKVLGTEEFYEAASSALEKDGVMVGNFLSFDKQLNHYVERITNAFEGGSTSLSDGEDGNVIIFAFKKHIDKRRLKTFQKRAVSMEELYGIPITDYANDLSL